MGPKAIAMVIANAISISSTASFCKTPIAKLPVLSAALSLSKCEVEGSYGPEIIRCAKLYFCSLSHSMSYQNQIQLSRVGAIIFDLGGVILNIDYDATIRAFQNLGIKDFQKHYTQAAQGGLFDSLEIGNISAGEFRDGIRVFAPKLSDEQIDKAWNALLLDLPMNRIETLEKIKQSCRTFLLSNTNEIHVKEFEKGIDLTMGRDRFYGCFEKLYYSSRIGLRKPDEEAFLRVLDENGLRAKDTLFIDDSIQHINAADKLGLMTYHFQPNDELSLLLV